VIFRNNELLLFSEVKLKISNLENVLSALQYFDSVKGVGTPGQRGACPRNAETAGAKVSFRPAVISII